MLANSVDPDQTPRSDLGLTVCQMSPKWDADAQADLCLRWAHTHFVGFVMRRLILRCYHFGFQTIVYSDFILHDLTDFLLIQDVFKMVSCTVLLNPYLSSGLFHINWTSPFFHLRGVWCICFFFCFFFICFFFFVFSFLFHFE